jgi:P-type conjugative transfer protein TrbJ
MRSLASIVLVLLALLVLAPVLAPPASGQYLVYDAAAYIQMIIDYLQALLDYYQQYQILVNEVEQLVQLIEQLETMYQNLESLDDAASDNPVRCLVGLRDVLYRVQGIVYSAEDVLERFDEVYTPQVSPDLAETEADKLEATLGTLRSMLAAAETHARASEDSSGRLAELMRQLEGAEGNLEALQAVGALTTQVATETTRSAEVQALSVNALAVAAAHELALREDARRTLFDWRWRAKTWRAGPARETFSVVPGAFSGENP